MLVSLPTPTYWTALVFRSKEDGEVLYPPPTRGHVFAGAGGGRDPAWTGRFEIGTPLFQHITQADKASRAYAAAHSEWKYDLAALAVVLHPEDDISVVGGFLRVQMRSQNAEPRPIAWSLTPPRLLDGETGSSTIELGVDLKFAKAIIRKDIPKAARAYITAFGEQTAEVEWRLRSTVYTKLEGDYKFGAVIRSPLSGANVGVHLHVEVVRRGRLHAKTFEADEGLVLSIPATSSGTPGADST